MGGVGGEEPELGAVGAAMENVMHKWLMARLLNYELHWLEDQGPGAGAEPKAMEGERCLVV
jgi:hypothetical protein